MIYKFIDTHLDISLEVYNDGNKAIFQLFDDNSSIGIRLDEKDIYNLIGALHSIKGKIEREVDNG